MAKSKTKLQVILGAGGALGSELARELPSYTEKLRLVSRHPVAVNEGDQLLSADLLDPQQVHKAVEGAEVAYLTVGLPYSLKVWQAQWPVIMENAIRACAAENVKLVFFDNVYMYDGTRMSPMKEDHPINPPSKKGRVRAAIAARFMEAVKNGEIKGLIARSADFYGPSIEKVSVLTETVINPLKAGKTANWMGKTDKKHSFTYVPDAAKATALLGNTAKAYGEVWHLPTAPDPYTGKEIIVKIASALGVKPKYRVAGKGILRLMGIFSPMMKELSEMAYQCDRDYVFDSTKFVQEFGIEPTSYEEGLRAVMAADAGK
jgi:nucleoside-diphosphate-sugar epimerase